MVVRHSTQKQFINYRIYYKQVEVVEQGGKKTREGSSSLS